MNIQVNFSVKSVTVGEWPETGTVLHTCPAEPVFPERLTLWPFLGTGGQQWASRQEVCPWGLEAWPVLGAFWEDRKDCCDPGPRAVGHSWWLPGSVPWLGVLPPEDPLAWDVHPPASRPILFTLSGKTEALLSLKTFFQRPPVPLLWVLCWKLMRTYLTQVFEHFKDKSWN